MQQVWVFVLPRRARILAIFQQDVESGSSIHGVMIYFPIG